MKWWVILIISFIIGGVLTWIGLGKEVLIFCAIFFVFSLLFAIIRDDRRIK